MTAKQLCELLTTKLKAIYPTHSYHWVKLESKEYSLTNKYQRPEYTLSASTYVNDDSLTKEQKEAQKVWIFIYGNNLKDVIQKFCVELLLGKEKYDKLQIDLNNKEVKEILNPITTN